MNGLCLGLLVEALRAAVAVVQGVVLKVRSTERVQNKQPAGTPPRPTIIGGIGKWGLEPLVPLWSACPRS